MVEKVKLPRPSWIDREGNIIPMSPKDAEAAKAEFASQLRLPHYVISLGREYEPDDSHIIRHSLHDAVETAKGLCLRPFERRYDPTEQEVKEDIEEGCRVTIGFYKGDYYDDVYVQKIA